MKSNERSCCEFKYWQYNRQFQIIKITENDKVTEKNKFVEGGII